MPYKCKQILSKNQFLILLIFTSYVLSLQIKQCGYRLGPRANLFL